MTNSKRGSLPDPNYASTTKSRCKRHPSEWGNKISAKHLKSWASAPWVPCEVCGKPMRKRLCTQKVCSKKCDYTRRKTDPVVAKAMTIGSCVRFGKGKRDFFVSLVQSSLDKPCPYCGQFLTLSNMSLDHIAPVGSLRGTSLGKHLDTADNLQMVCQRCNRGKGNLSDRAFRKLLEFLRGDPEISAYVWRRIAGGGVQFMAYRVNQARRARGR